MHRSIATVRYRRTATKVGFGGIVYWVIEGAEILKPGNMDSLGAVLDAELAGKLTSENPLKAKFLEFQTSEVRRTHFHAITRYSAVCAAHPQGDELPRILLRRSS